jgi:hypothetical protein
MLSAEEFQLKNEIANEQAAKYAARIPKIQERIKKLEAEISGNLFTERFSRHVGLQELTRAIVVEFISEVKVYSVGRIETIFNYADEYAQIDKLFRKQKYGGNGQKD